MSESYLREILEQPAVVNAVPDRFRPEILARLERVAQELSSNRYRNVILTGMGGSLHSVYGLWIHLSRSLRTPVSVWDTSELIQQSPGMLRSDTLLIAVSQSGESVELQKLTGLDQRPGTSICITNSPSNTLADWADIAIATYAGPESTASTKTYTGGLAALYLLGDVLTHGDTIRSADAIRSTGGRIESLLDDRDRIVDGACAFLGAQQPIFFIARGASISSARMGALLTQEAAKLATIAYSGGQFRHGPLEMVRSGFVSILFAGDQRGAALNRKIVADIDRLGGKCLVVGADDTAVSNSGNIRTLAIPPMEERLLPIIEILPIQLLMIPLARARGFEPAAFLNASKITSEE